MKSVDNILGMNLVEIESGSFLMGNPIDETSCAHEKQHKVNLSNAFFLQTTPVTVGQWRTFVEDTGYKTDAEKENLAWCHSKIGWKIPGIYPTWAWEEKPGIYWNKPGFSQSEQHPVTCVNWNDTQAFIEWLNQKESATYRLPTEAEWEYACRAGTDTTYSFGNHISAKRANYNIYDDRWMSSHRLIYSIRIHLYFMFWKRSTSKVGRYAANPWGLYDMHGNVWEWCEDRSADRFCDGKQVEIITDTYIDDITDPLCIKGTQRITRGGSWYYTSLFCASSFRRSLEVSIRASGIGFRLAMS